MLAAAAQGSLLFLLRQSPSRRGGPIGVDDAGLRMRWIAESLAEQAFGRRGIAQRREQEVDGGTGGIDGPVYVTPTALHSNIRLVNTPGFVGRFEMMAQLVVSELKKEGSLRLAGLGIFPQAQEQGTDGPQSRDRRGDQDFCTNAAALHCREGAQGHGPRRKIILRTARWTAAISRFAFSL